MVDLSSAPVVDCHCHPWRNEDLLAADPAGLEERVTLAGTLLLAAGPAGEPALRELSRLSGSTPVALALRRRLAAHLGCEPTREAVAAARREALAADPAAYNARLWQSARVAALVYDDGYPLPGVAPERFAADSGARVHRVGRIEPWLAELREQARRFSELEDAFVARLDEEAVDPELVAFKSVIAYRTGLDVAEPAPSSYCEREFELWRRSDWAETREHGKTVRDRLFHRLLEAARRHDRPVHVHCGGGDPSIQLAHARPQDLFPLLARHPDQPVVLVHSGWPWLEEGAYVAAVLPNAYLDVSITVPWATLAIDQKLEALLGLAPPAKVLHGSDEASEPEVIWLAAQLAREALERVLGTAVERAWLGEADAVAIGKGVLAGNARRLHGLA